MNKLGTIVTYLPFKWYALGIVLLLIFFLMGPKVIQKVESINKIVNTHECPEGIIPDKIRMIELNYTFTPANEESPIKQYSGAMVIRKISSTWDDGTLITTKLFGRPWCYAGSSEGENINHLYCRGLGYSKTTGGVDNNGVILKSKTVSYDIDLELLPLGIIGNITDQAYDKLSGHTYLRVNFSRASGEVEIGEMISVLDSRRYVILNYSVISAKCTSK